MFSTIDYLFFSASILLSMCVGIYFGFWKKATTSDEYLLGNRTMTVIPIALSLIASNISGVTLLALPSDVYIYGANCIWLCVSIVLGCILANYVFLPVIGQLNVASIFQYIELRFNRRIKILASCIYTLHILIYNAVVAYIPAIALSQATGIDPHIITSVVCIICIAYTTIGGLKAVVWTDAFQFGFMLVAVVAVFVLGVLSVGGFDVVYERALHGQRLDFNFSMDLTIRDGFWQVLLGNLVNWIYNLSFHPGCVQKVLALPTFPKMKRVVLMLGCGAGFFHLLSILIGVVIYARYSTCDPISTGKVSRVDQIVAFFVMEHSQAIPGLAGLFIAGLFSAALSTLSSSLNSLAATIHGDFISSIFPSDTLKSRENSILKLIVVITGSICTILALFVDQMGSLLGFIMALLGLVYGIYAGLFCLGIIFPNANSKGAFWGTVSSFVVVGTITVLNQWYNLQGDLENFSKPVSIEGCAVPFNITLSSIASTPEPPFILFRLSFWCNSVMSYLMLIIIGLLVSSFTEPDTLSLDPNLISPISRRLMAKFRMHDVTVNKYSAGTICQPAECYSFISDSDISKT
ncbi:hypothetical protein RI129_008352 [Pyrocoelia pectoralis]|uniref:Sodium-coupled monocarboxylate transporter 1 n=1 Tax=Pyrocoelia pectoralis TaxID=417401 RepID=A0AAN7ZDM4_9COLE